MKKFIINFKQTIRFIVSIIISREFAFSYCILGTVAQISHTYYLIENISSLVGIWKGFQALLLSIFISSSLLYFVAISDKDSEPEEYRKVNFAITLFTIIEIIINIFYYSRNLIINKIELNQEYNIFDFIFALLISALIPITIKLYSSHIRAKEWILDIENDREALVSSNKKLDVELEYAICDNLDDKINTISKDFESRLETMLTNFGVEALTEEKISLLIQSKLEELSTEVTDNISSKLVKNQQLFLTQFENKLKLLSSEYLAKLKN